MIKRNREIPAKYWLRSANSHFQIAKEFNKDAPRKFSSNIAFHAHEAARGYLNAFVSLNNQRPIDTFDVARVLTQCERIDDNFRTIKEATYILKPFDIKVCYPGGSASPKQAALAVIIAAKVKRFVIKKLGNRRSSFSNLGANS